MARLTTDSTRERLRTAARRQWADPEARARILAGQRAARLVRDNLRLCGWIAKRFAWTGLDREDLAQAAFPGLVRAAETFDPGRGAFSTWAWWWMRSHVQREVAQMRSTIRVPQYQPASADPTTTTLAAPVGDAWPPTSACQPRQVCGLPHTSFLVDSRAQRAGRGRRRAGRRRRAPLYRKSSRDSYGSWAPSG